jgi:hypothetical protein
MERTRGGGSVAAAVLGMSVAAAGGGAGRFEGMRKNFEVRTVSDITRN